MQLRVIRSGRFITIFFFFFFFFSENHPYKDLFDHELSLLAAGEFIDLAVCHRGIHVERPALKTASRPKIARKQQDKNSNVELSGKRTETCRPYYSLCSSLNGIFCWKYNTLYVRTMVLCVVFTVRALGSECVLYYCTVTVLGNCCTTCH